MTKTITINRDYYSFEINPKGGYVGYLNGRLIISGYASSYENAIASVEDYINKLLGKNIVTPAKEEVKIEESNANEVEEAVVDKEIISTEPALSLNINTSKNEDETFTVTLTYDVEGAVIKYTTNGRDVVSSSKIYKEAFSVAEGTVINANAYVNKEVVASIKAYEVK